MREYQSLSRRTASRQDLLDPVFSARYFARTLSYREFVTSFSLALLLLAIYSLLDYYANEDRQRRWEYEIDSLLSPGKGWVTDYFSGARVYFPTAPDSIKGLTENNAGYRCYYAKKYGMQFTLFSFQIGAQEIKELTGTVYSADENQGRVVKTVTIDSTNYDFDAFLISQDSARTYYTRWIYANPYLYKVYSWYPNGHGDTIGYAKNARSFLGTFQITNTDRYWIEKNENSGPPSNFFNSLKNR